MASAARAFRLVVDATSEKPPYVQFADALRAEILSGALPPGKQLPTVRALAAESEVSPGTVKGAYRVLTDDGLLRASPMGTWVAAREDVITARRRYLDENVAADFRRYVSRGFTEDEVRAALRRAAAKELK